MFFVYDVSDADEKAALGVRAHPGFEHLRDTLRTVVEQRNPLWVMASLTSLLAVVVKQPIAELLANNPRDKLGTHR
jgi:hypothetical protein